MKLYHGSSSEINVDGNRPMYFTADINEAKQYALGLDDLGNFNEESFIYEIEIDETQIVREDDFDYFDSAAYTDYQNLANVTYNPESGYYIVKNPSSLSLISHFENSL